MSASPSQRRKNGRERFSGTEGFTLVEVLVAFTVLATLLPVLFRGVVVMRTGSASFDDHTERQIAARAVLEDALGGRDLAVGRISGIRNGRRWTLTAKALDLDEQLPPPDRDNTDAQGDMAAQTPAGPDGARAAPAKEERPRWGLQRLTVRIESAGKPLEIETIRLVKAERRK